MDYEHSADISIEREIKCVVVLPRNPIQYGVRSRYHDSMQPGFVGGN